MNTRYLLRLAAAMVMVIGPWGTPPVVMAQGFNPMGWMDPSRWMDRHGYGDDYGYGVPGYGPGAPAYGPAYGSAYPPAGYGYGTPYGGGAAPAYPPGYAPAPGLPSHGQGTPGYGWEPTPRPESAVRNRRADGGGRSHRAPRGSFSDSGMGDPWLDPAPRHDGGARSSRSAPWDGAEGPAWPPAESAAPSRRTGREEWGRDNGPRQEGRPGSASGWGAPTGYDRPLRREGFTESAPGAALPPAGIEWPDRSRGVGQGGRGEDWGTVPPSRDLPQGGRWPSGGR